MKTPPPQPSREHQRHYISASDDDIQVMLEAIVLKSLPELFAHIPEDILFNNPPALPEELSYEKLKEEMETLAGKNTLCESFIGDGLPDYTVHPIVSFVSGLRKLTTAYTPYQPERSQGTLMTHWIYQCLMAKLTGFEAINTSLYDRSTALYEAIITALRLNRKASTIIIPKALYPHDLEVLDTLIADTEVKVVYLPLDPQTGCISIEDVSTIAAQAKEGGESVAALAFPQVNTLGLLEDVDGLADLCRQIGALSIAIIDPMHLGTGGLKPPCDFGQEGADIIIGEGQHLAIGPNGGGPGLGIFGVRHNSKVKHHVRATPGRYVGKAKDLKGRDCRVMVLSTREQHIRKDRATSNICSNQAFVATLAGSSLLARGEEGMQAATTASHRQAKVAAERLASIDGLALAFPQQSFFNEFTLSLPIPASQAIAFGRAKGLHLGVDVSDRIAGKLHLLKLSFSDKPHDLDRLVDCFESLLNRKASAQGANIASPPKVYLREGKVGLPQISLDAIKDYYQELNALNVSPDSGCYPLGSCTMKYNPLVNDWAAGLPGFAHAHPQAPVEDLQGSLEVLFQIQEWFKKITGLAGVTTQPVAGAQGELVGLKLFQAYHRAKGDTGRDIILIPESAHGTNFATAVTAGFQPISTSTEDDAQDHPGGIILLKADPKGQIDRQHLESIIAAHGERISGIMVTNPNTSGLFEIHFQEIAQAIHSIGGLVYMDGANMNAIAAWVDLGAMGVDAVHNNLHKTWTIPHGGGGPGDAIVAVSERLLDFLPGWQVVRQKDRYELEKPAKSIGSFHRHWGNLAHKVRCLTYLFRLGREGVQRISAVAVLAARYLFEQFKQQTPTLPRGAEIEPRMHEFILSLKKEAFVGLEAIGIPQNNTASRLGKLFLDFGFHAPTVAWPEPLGLMIEPTESFNKEELDRFAQAVQALLRLVQENPECLLASPRFTPVDRIDEVAANRYLCLSETLDSLPPLNPNRLDPEVHLGLSIEEIEAKICGCSVLNHC